MKKNITDPILKDVFSFELHASPRYDVQINPESVHCSQQRMKFFFFFLYSSKILQNILHLHPTILSNYYTNYTNTTGTGPQGAKDNDYPVAINIKTCK